MYTEKVMDHFNNPRNVGKMDDADGVGEVVSPTCGDTTKIFIQVEGDIIKDVKFQTLGCCAAVASSSMLTEMVKGKTLEEGLRITKQEVAGELGGLPPAKLHCSNLAADALHVAIKNYMEKKEENK